MSDSPMWKRGKRSRSNRTTRWPCWARSVEAVEPAGPPPMTTTSGAPLRDCSGGNMRGLLQIVGGMSEPVAVWKLVGQAGRVEQIDQRLEVGARQVAELSGVAGPHVGIELPEQR